MSITKINKTNSSKYILDGIFTTDGYNFDRNKVMIVSASSYIKLVSKDTYLEPWDIIVIGSDVHVKDIVIDNMSKVSDLFVGCNVNVCVKEKASFLTTTFYQMDVSNITITGKHNVTLQRCWGSFNKESIQGAKFKILKVTECRPHRYDFGMLGVRSLTIEGTCKCCVGNFGCMHYHRLRNLTIFGLGKRVWYGGLVRQTSLKYLELFNAHLDYYGFINELKGLVSLSLSGCNIKDLSILKGLSPKYLDLSGIEATDFTPLSAIPFEILDVSRNKITCLEFLRGHKLFTLRANHNEIISTEPLSECKQLQIAELDWNYVVDVHPLAKCPRISSILVANNYVFNVNKFRGTTIRTLLAQWTKFTPDNMFNVDDSICKHLMTGLITQISLLEPQKTDLHSLYSLSIYTSTTKNAILKDYWSNKLFDRLTFKQVFDRVWPIIRSHPDRNLIEQIIHEIMAVDCAKNRYYSMAFLLCGFDDRFVYDYVTRLKLDETIKSYLDNTKAINYRDKIRDLVAIVQNIVTKK